MKFDKRISRLLAKSLLLSLSISCFGFCFTSAMENKSEKSKADSKKFLEKKHSSEERETIKILEMLDRTKKPKKRKKNDEQKRINQCIRKAIISQNGNFDSFITRYSANKFNEKGGLFFSENIFPIHVRIISKIISSLRGLKLMKDSPAYSLLATVENIKKNILKSYVLPINKSVEKLDPQDLDLLNKLLPDEQLDLFNKNFEDIITSFFGTYKGTHQNSTADSLLKTLNIKSSGKWANANPTLAKARGKKCICDAILLLEQESQEPIIDLKEEEKK